MLPRLIWNSQAEVTLLSQSPNVLDNRYEPLYLAILLFILKDLYIVLTY